MQDLAPLIIALAVLPSVLVVIVVKRLSRRRAKATWDSIFENLNLNGLQLEGGPYLSGRQYHGTLLGREVHIYLHPVRKQHHTALVNGDTLRIQQYAGHVLEIFLEGKVGTRFAWPLPSKSSQDSWQTSCTPLLRQLNKLTANGNGTGVQGLPNALGFRVRVDKSLLKASWLKEVLSTLKELLDELERFSPRGAFQEATLIERWTVKNRHALHRALWGISLGLILLCSGAFFLISTLY